MNRLACAIITCCASCGRGKTNLISGILHPHDRMFYMKRVCETCHCEYDTPPSIRLRFCSAKCCGISKRKALTKLCIVCSASFSTPPSRDSIYCSKSCHRKHKNTIANPSWTRDVSGENNPMFGVQRFGKDNPMFGKRKAECSLWKGGRKVRKDGYVIIAVADDYLNPCDTSSSGTKYALEHRVVMEQHIGRPLLKTEVVHHVDRNPSNNHIDNLQLFSSHEEHLRLAHGKR